MELERSEHTFEFSQTDRQVEEQYDIVVCGGGLAGLCAAVAAARNGAKVCLVQDRPVFGGNSSSEIRVPPQGAASFHAYARETGIISELLIEERARNHEASTHDNGWINSVWDMVQYDLAVNTPNLTFHLNTTVIGVRMLDKATIEAVLARVQHAETQLTLMASCFIDCTGDGVVAAMAGCQWRMGSEGRDEFGEPHAPENASGDVMGSSLHFKAKDMGRPVPFQAPKWAVKYDNPDFFYKQGRWPGEIRNGYWWMELSAPWHTIYDNEKLRHELTRHVLGVWDWVKNRDPELKEAAKNYALDWIGQVPGKRESRRIIGQYFMTEHDPLNKTVFEDEIAYGGWFIDLHEPGGLLAKFSERAAAEGHDGAYAARSYVGPYGIPLRILIAKNMRNLMMAGRNVSVTHVALGTVRVMGTTSLMGQGAGTAAAVAVRRGIAVEEVPKRCVKEVQQTLLRDGCFLLNAVNEDEKDLARLASVQASSEMSLAGAEPAPHADPNADLLKRRRGQWIALAQGRIDKLFVCLSNLSNGVAYVEARIYPVEHVWDYRVEPDRPLAQTVLKVPAGLRQWVEWPVHLDAPALAGRYVRLDLLTNTAVCWHAAEEVAHGHVSAYEMETGQMRRYGTGTTMSYRIVPSQSCYNADQVLSGVTRPYRYTNVWRSDPAQALPQWVELSWKDPVSIGTIQLTFPGYLLRDYRHDPPLYMDPQCPRELKAEAWRDGGFVEIGALHHHYQRQGIIKLQEAIVTDRIRISVHATNGDASAAIYEIRCYSEVTGVGSSST